MKAVPVPRYWFVMGTFCGTIWPAMKEPVEPASEPPRGADPYGEPRERRGCPSEDEPPGPTRPPTGPQYQQVRQQIHQQIHRGRESRYNRSTNRSANRPIALLQDAICI